MEDSPIYHGVLGRYPFWEFPIGLTGEYPLCNYHMVQLEAYVPSENFTLGHIWLILLFVTELPTSPLN